MPRCPWQSITVSTVRNVGLRVGAVIVVVEEGAINVQRVDRVDLRNVDEIDAHRPAPLQRLHADGGTAGPITGPRPSAPFPCRRPAAPRSRSGSRRSPAAARGSA